MKQKFRNTQLGKKSLAHLEKVNEIVADYQAQGYKLTLRQLYYQLVSRNIIENHDREYKKLSRVLTDGRMSGIVDWDAIEDRLRVPNNVYHVDGVKDALEDTISHYRLNRQKGQLNHIEVWVEKDAISNVLKRVTQKYGINLLVNRGYGSVTAMKDAYDRYLWRLRRGQNVKLLYLGDHDPSGLDMIRDIDKRVNEMLYTKDFECEVIPIALTMEQIKEHDPPPNPAKLTDSRSAGYVETHGYENWEVDALPPEVLHSVLEENILKYMDEDEYNFVLDNEEKQIEDLQNFVDNYGEGE